MGIADRMLAQEEEHEMVRSVLAVGARAPRRARATIGIGVLCASAAMVAALPAVSGAASPRAVPHTTKTAVVVKISKARGGFKNVLTTTAGVGATLYTAKSCPSSCRSSWPPLYMPKGKTVPQGPKGFTGLGTVKLGSRLQVTYKKHPLYRFTGDSGSSVNGNGLSGFTVIHNV